MADNEAPLDYALPDPGAIRRRRAVQITVIIGCVLMLLAGFCGASLNRAHTQVNKANCANTLSAIGQAIMLYQQDYLRIGAPYPPNLRVLMETQTASPELLVCPASPDVKASSLASIGTPGTCSYIYVGSSLRPWAAPNQTLALEDPANHRLEGGNVLHGDGSVTWMNLQDIVQILNDLQQGLNPPSTTTTLTTAQAAKIYNTKWKPLMPQLKSGVWRIPTTAPTTAPAGPH